MIARNLIKFAEAMALQLPLRFGPLRMLRQSRPTTRAGRAARAARSAIRKAALAIRVMHIVKPTRATPKAVEPQTMFQLCIALTRLENLDMWGFNA